MNVVFVCDHGAAKSVIAAAWLECLAAEAGAPVRAVARGTDPDPKVSPVAAAGLLAEGIDVREWSPRLLDPAELASASRVVSLGPDLAGIVPDGVPFERWSEVPPVADGYALAQEAILKRLRGLLAASRAP